MTTLKQAYEEFVYDIFRSFSEEHKKYIVRKFLEMDVEWLTQAHKELTEKIQYEELYTNEVIPLLIKKLEAEAKP